MPRNGSGSYTLPTGNPVVTGTTIETTWANNTLSDIATAMTDSLSRSGQGGMTAAFRAADGSSSVPGIAWTSETNSGFYRAGSNDVRFVIATAEAYRVTGTTVTFSLPVATAALSATGNVSFDGGTFVFNESGADRDARFEGDTDANLLFTDASTDRVGVGTNSPATKLAVRGATQAKEVALRWERATDGAVAGGLGYFYDAENSVAVGAVSNHPVKLIVNDATVATLDTSGNLGVGTATPAFGSGSGVEIQRAGIATLRLENSTASNSFEMYADTGPNGINLRGRDSSPMNFWTGNTSHMTLDASGNLGVGTSTPAAKLDVVGSVGNVQVDGSGARLTFTRDDANYIRYGSANGSLIFEEGSTERFRIGSSGEFGLAGANYGTSGQVLTSQGSGSPPQWSTAASGDVTLNGVQTLTNKTIAFGSNTLSDVASLSTAQTFTGTKTFSGSSSALAMVLNDAAETCTVSATAATGTINYDITTQSVLFYTTNASANWTTNFRASSGTSLNTALATGQSVTVAFLVTQGSTAYYNNVVQVDGTTSGVTTRWQGGTAPTAGNASGVDVYTYTIVKTGSATFSVFAAQTRFA